MSLKSNLVRGAVGVLIGAGLLTATAASARTYVVCNRWDECWRVHEHYTTYPADARIVYHDESWWAQHEHDTDVHWRILADPANDHGWYDRDGVWHPFDHD